MNVYHYFLLLNGHIIHNSPKLLELVNHWNDTEDLEKNMLNYITVYSNLQNHDNYYKIVTVSGFPNNLLIQKIFFIH